MNAKSLVLHFHSGLFKAGQPAKSSRRTTALGVRIPNLRNYPDGKVVNFELSEHEALFLLQRNLMMK